MSQSTKLFLILLFLFIVFTTMNGHLESYIKIMLGKKPPASGGGILGTIGDVLGKGLDISTKIAAVA